MLLWSVAVVAGVPLRLETVVERLVAVLVLLIKVVLVRLVQIRVLRVGFGASATITRQRKSPQ